MATAPSSDLKLTPLNGKARPAEDWVTTFHLVLVVLDPFTYESAWLLDTAGRILTHFSEADCRPAWLVTANSKETAGFLGPWSERFLTFTDPEREVVKSLGLNQVPALVHLDQSLEVSGAAEGWDPAAWSGVAKKLADVMSWSEPEIPATGDPAAYPGSPALPG